MPRKPISERTLDRRLLRLDRAACYFAAFFPKGSPVPVKDRRTGKTITGRSCGASNAWILPFVEVKMPRIRLPNGKKIALNVVARNPRYKLPRGTFPSLDQEPDWDLLFRMFLEHAGRRQKRKSPMFRRLEFTRMHGLNAEVPVRIHDRMLRPEYLPTYRWLSRAQLTPK